MKMKLYAASLLAILLTTSAQSQVITGAGATFPYPIYSKWMLEYKKQTGVAINYQSIGSGGGIRQVIAKTVSFGATDAPLSDKELQDNQLTQFPTVIGAVVPIVNLPRSENGISLTEQQLVSIYTGEIKDWNDSRLSSAFSGSSAPNLPIVVVYRADASGTTYIWTNYLSSVSPMWKLAIGTATSVQWPTGIGAKGNEGVAGFVGQTSGSIGYVEFTFAKQTKTPIARLNGITADLKSFTLKSWPITAPTYILVPKVSKDRQVVLDFFEWAKKNGSEMARELDYIPL